jgi:hypothetical protein
MQNINEEIYSLLCYQPWWLDLWWWWQSWETGQWRYATAGAIRAKHQS